MSKLITKISITLMLLLSMTSCFLGTIYGNGDIITIERDVYFFEDIEADFIGDIYIKQGSFQEISITGDSNIIGYIDTDVENGVLKINSTANYSTTRAIEIEITIPDMDSVTVYGVSDVDIQDFQTNSLTLITDGVGSITASGYTTNLTAKVKGVGDLNLKELISLYGSASVEGVGNIDIYANKTLSLSVDGVGDITYYGKASITSYEDDGVGTIRKGD